MNSSIPDTIEYYTKINKKLEQWNSEEVKNFLIEMELGELISELEENASLQGIIFSKLNKNNTKFIQNKEYQQKLLNHIQKILEYEQLMKPKNFSAFTQLEDSIFVTPGEQSIIKKQIPKDVIDIPLFKGSVYQQSQFKNEQNSNKILTEEHNQITKNFEENSPSQIESKNGILNQVGELRDYDKDFYEQIENLVGASDTKVTTLCQKSQDQNTEVIQKQHIVQKDIKKYYFTQLNSVCPSREIPIDRTFYIGRKIEINDFTIQDSTISKSHAQIKYNQLQEIFQIKDQGSSTGTFFRIQDKIELKINQYYECGILLFQVKDIQKQYNNIISTVQIIESYQSLLDDRIYTLQHNDYIGRDIRTCVISHPEDIYMSNKHAYIQQQNDKLYLVDNSKNGAWIRLSLEKQESYWYDLPLNQIIRFGDDKIYQITNHPTTSNINKCIFCNSKADLLLYPCTHKSLCNKCYNFKTASETKEIVCGCGILIQHTQFINQ